MSASALVANNPLLKHQVTSRCNSNSWCSRAALQWRHYGRDGVSNHQLQDCLLNRLFRRRSKKASKLRVTVLCAGNSPVTCEFPAQMASNAEKVSIWWLHHGFIVMVAVNWNTLLPVTMIRANRYFRAIRVTGEIMLVIPYLHLSLETHLKYERCRFYVPMNQRAPNVAPVMR